MMATLTLDFTTDAEGFDVYTPGPNEFHEFWERNATAGRTGAGLLWQPFGTLAPQTVTRPIMMTAAGVMTWWQFQDGAQDGTIVRIVLNGTEINENFNTNDLDWTQHSIAIPANTTSIGFRGIGGFDDLDVVRIDDITITNVSTGAQSLSLTATVSPPSIVLGSNGTLTVTRSGGSTTGYSSTQTGTINFNFQGPVFRTFTVTGATIGDPVTVNVTGSNFIGQGTSCLVTGPDGVRRLIWSNGPIGTSRTETVAYPIGSEVNGTWIIEMRDIANQVHAWDSATLTIGEPSSTAADALPITLTSSATGVATVPASLTIPANQSSATATVASVSEGSTTITATYAGTDPDTTATVSVSVATGTGPAPAGSGNVGAVARLVGSGVAPAIAAKAGSGSVVAATAIDGVGQAIMSGGGSLVAIAEIAGTGQSPIVAASGIGSVVALASISGHGQTPAVAAASGSGSFAAVGQINGQGQKIASGSGSVESVARLTGQSPVSGGSMISQFYFHLCG